MTGTALITGISGFTGPYVSAQLQARGYEIHGIGGGRPDDGVALHDIDLRDVSALETLVSDLQPEVVVHLAAIAFVGHRDFTDMYTSNIVGTRNLLATLAECDARLRRVLLASSANIYGNADVEFLHEDCEPRPENDYAVSKYAMELMARLWLERIPISIVRPFNYTGVGQSPSFLIPKIVGHFARGERLIELGNTDVYRDFSDVRTVADAYVRLLHESEDGGVYNVCSGRQYSIGDILAMLSEITGRDLEVRVNPAFVRENEVKRLRGSNRRLVSVIGGLREFPLPETLAWMYEAACSEGSP